MKNSGLSRRDFVKFSAIGATALGMGATNLMASAMNEKDVKWDEEYDVVIIGSGFAALAAGVTSAKKGNKVVLIEKMGRTGGNSVINGGIFAVPNSDMQKKAGIKDSTELFIKDCLKAGRGINHVDLLAKIGERAQDAYKLTLDCGAKYIDQITHAGGHSVPRSLQTEVGSGAGIVLPMTATFEKLEGASIKKRTKFDDFVFDDKGAVVGVIVRENYKFDGNLMSDDVENKGGDTKYIKAKKGVVLAAGGFCRDKIFRRLQDPRITPETDSTNQPGSTAGALLAAFRAGAYPVQPSWIQYGPWGCADETGFGVGSMFNVNGAFPFGISVDPRTGKRYMNELADRRTRTEAMFKVIHEKGEDDKNFPINFCDSRALPHMLPAHYEKAIAAGICKKFDTLDALAAEYKIPVEELKKTVARYNEFVKKGVDEDFGKPVVETTTKGIDISVPPFYAERGTPKVHHTMGGLNINTKAQVMNSQTAMPIPNLYAAGEITGGVHGASRLGSVAITDCLTFGMIAAETIG